MTSNHDRWFQAGKDMRRNSGLKSIRMNSIIVILGIKIREFMKGCMLVERITTDTCNNAEDAG